jgi:hypothetical protein
MRHIILCVLDIFIFGLFNDALSSSHYIDSNDMTIDEWWMGEIVEGSGRGLFQGAILKLAWMNCGKLRTGHLQNTSQELYCLSHRTRSWGKEARHVNPSLVRFSSYCGNKQSVSNNQWIRFLKAIEIYIHVYIYIFVFAVYNSSWNVTTRGELILHCRFTATWTEWKLWLARTRYVSLGGSNRIYVDLCLLAFSLKSLSNRWLLNKSA